MRGVIMRKTKGRKIKPCTHDALEHLGDNLFKCMNKNCGKWIRKNQNPGGKPKKPKVYPWLNPPSSI